MNNFDAKGQILYVDPAWLTGQTCLFNVKDPIDYKYASEKLLKMRSDFINELMNEGFVITYDCWDKRDNIISLTMNPVEVCDFSVTDSREYKKIIDRYTFDAAGEKLNYPFSLSITDYFNNPFYPSVLKNELLNGGKDKILIERPAQVEIFKKYYNQNKFKSRYFDSFNNTIFQQLIETPTKYKTYMRVLISASGDVMGASLKYSKPCAPALKMEGVFEKELLNPKSEFYINATKMFNYYSGGGNIQFCDYNLIKEEKKILKAHGIDPNNMCVPEEVLEVSKNIAQRCSKAFGVILGIDFILNEADNKWYYLENQAYPAIDEWLATRGIRGIEINSIKDFVAYNRLEIEARHESLRLIMQRKFSEEYSKKRTGN